jgi:enediyne biosynthesis protein E4
VRSGGSYCSEDERVARFGLGERARVEQVEVRWPSGAVDRRAGVPADQVLLLREGERQ